MTLLGAPGSGKGFYGRLLAQAWNVPLYSASRILRAATANNDTHGVDSGTLLDCDMVCDALREFLNDQHPPQQQNIHSNQTITPMPSSFFLMDGFPRTLRQIERMHETWPAALCLTTALHLNVPDAVCVAKIQGRRLCTICHQEPNLAHVRVQHNISQTNNNTNDYNLAIHKNNTNTDLCFDLPPSLPMDCRGRCNPQQQQQQQAPQPNTVWTQRPDDADGEIVRRRLLDYRTHEQPLLDYYHHSNSKANHNDDNGGSGLFSFAPYRGIQDFFAMQDFLETWFRARSSRVPAASAGRQ